MKKLFALILLFPCLAFATGEKPVKPPSANATAISGAVVNSTGGSPVVTGSGGAVTSENKAYGFAAPGLASSANACQGSVSVIAVGFTFDVIWCRTLEKARAMHSFAPNNDAEKAMLCTDEEIREAYKIAGAPCK